MRCLLLSALLVSTSSFSEAVSFQSSTNLHLNSYFNRVLDLSCDKTGILCAAVGFGEKQQLHNRLVYTSHDGGINWSEPVTLLSPKEEVDPKLSSNPNLASIHCSNNGLNCFIASAPIINKIPTPIVYASQDGGMTWSEPKVLPLPRSANKKQTYHNDSLNAHVACDRYSIRCAITGSLTGDSSSSLFAYTTQDGGETWVNRSMKNPSSQAPSYLYHGSFLANMNCNKEGLKCMAAGFSLVSNSIFSNNYNAKPIVYQSTNGGADWSKPLILPTPIGDFIASTLTAISCDTSGIICTTIGYSYNYKTEKTDLFSFTTLDGGVNWGSKVSIPGDGRTILNSLDCNSSGKRCTAAGNNTQDFTGFSLVKPIVYITLDSGKSWTQDDQVSFSYSSFLTNIFCNQSGERCIAVGLKAEDPKAENAKGLTAINNSSFLKSFETKLHSPQKDSKAAVGN